jgi:hypothetical protein
MKNIKFLVAAVALCSALSSFLQATPVVSPISYAFVDNAAFQNGLTFSGNITTDGTLGALNVGNILSIEWTIMNTSTSTLIATTSNPTFSFGGVFASATQITLPVLPAFTSSINISHPTGQGQVYWQRSAETDFGDFVSPSQDYYAAQNPTSSSTPWWQQVVNAAPLNLQSNPDGAWIIAEVPVAVPEPSTYGLVFSGLTLAFVALRRRKSKQA